MCGVAGYLDLSGRTAADPGLVGAMIGRLVHRGPDSAGQHVEGPLGLGIRRLSIVDLRTGDQPLYNEDRSLVLVCNGEIFNHEELRAELETRGHRFASRSDVEVILHLYEECGSGLMARLNGQFSFALHDRTKQHLLLARDGFGITPLYYAVQGSHLIFGSEIKAILEHPLAGRDVDLAGLDQVVCFPGLVSPRTMFRGISSLPPGHYLLVADGKIAVERYWDLDYPLETSATADAEEFEEELTRLFRLSVQRRMRADVPVGVYVSGGLDSSMIAGMMRQLAPDIEIVSLAVAFDDRTLTEEKQQRLIADAIKANHHELRFGVRDTAEHFASMIYHAECPVKETYNTCSLALSALTRACGLKVVLGGEGADELFAGYPGYRFDEFVARSPKPVSIEEAELRRVLWGDERFGYEKTYSSFARERQPLYSPRAWDRLRGENALTQAPVDVERLRGRHRLHQRSYVDCRLRLADHLLGDHGDHMLMAHSVEGRYPFLDRDLVDFARRLPPDAKLKGLEEKYILKRIAAPFVPRRIVTREKFGFHAAGSPGLLAQGLDWVEDLLCPDGIRRQGYFSVDAVERLKCRYSQPGFRLDPRTDDDLLLIVLSFSLFLNLFNLPPA